MRFVAIHQHCDSSSHEKASRFHLITPASICLTGQRCPP
jgi:hypothetical protein